MKKIYISGKITGLDYPKTIFKAAEIYLIKEGYKVVNPMSLVPYNPNFDWI